MTTYYISPDGSDSNNGLGPDASHASNKPYLTLGKAMNTGSAVVPGDTVYIAPGYYYSANCSPIAGICSVGSPTQFIGDPTNARGFKTAAGVRLAPGLPWLTTRTSGEGIDSPIASTSNLIQATTNDPSGLQFKFLVMECRRSQNIINVEYNTSTDILFQDCVLIGGVVFGVNDSIPTAGRNWTIRRCTVIGGFVSGSASSAAATADADLNVLIEETLLLGHRPLGTMALGKVDTTGNMGGGFTVRNCTLVCSGGGSAWFATTAGRFSTVAPMTVSNCLMFGADPAFNAGTAGHIIDGGRNRLMCWNATPYTNVTQNVTAGQESYVLIAPNVVLPNLVTWGLQMPRADFLGWTDAAHANQKFSSSGSTTADLRGRTVRPWGAGASIGCWQAQDVTQDTASAITGGGTNSLKLTGAGEVSLYIPVDATGFTVSVRTKSTSYGGTNYPQMIVVANPSCGVTSDTTVTAAAATEETITTATITPTSKGVMEVRLISRSSSTTSTTHFDLLSAA